MPRFAALLRGVNVGKGNRVPMAGFRRSLEDLGYTDVDTLLNSGNAVFSASRRPTAEHATAIAAALAAEFSVAVPVIVKSRVELSAVISASPAVPPEPHWSRFLVAFAQDQAALEGLAPIAALVRAPERFVVTGYAAYLYCPQGMLSSRAGKALLGRAGESITTRNWATVLKLRALLDAA